MVFAKNSDRPPGEPQVAWPFGRRASAGCTLRTQYLSIGDTGAHATLLSCPTWLWGAEHGVNEHGVAIGNERVATTHDAAAAPPALIGMDLVRLGLERARTAADAVDVMTALLEACGQGGVADAIHGEAYDSSFLVADPNEAFVVETAGRDYAVAPFAGGTAISNRLALGTGWTRGVGRTRPRRRLRAFPGPLRAHRPRRRPPGRRAAAFSSRSLPSGLTPRATASHLRDHGAGPWGAPGAEGEVSPVPRRVGADFGGVSVCMHVRGRYVSAASLIAELPDDVADGAPLRAWVALGSPCASIYVPAFPRSAAGPPPFVPCELSREELWQAADAVRRRVEEDPDALAAVRSVLDPVEDELWGEADDGARAPRSVGRGGRLMGRPGAGRTGRLYPLIA